MSYAEPDPDLETHFSWMTFAPGANIMLSAVSLVQLVRQRVAIDALSRPDEMKWRLGGRHWKAFVMSQSLVDPIPSGLVQPALVAARGDARYEKSVVLIERTLKIICERVGR